MSNPGSLLDLFARPRRKPAIFCHLLSGNQERAVSFAAFFAGAAEFRRRYEAAGITRGAVIIIATEFSLEGMCAFAGALIGGFVPAFLAPLTERQNADH